MSLIKVIFMKSKFHLAAMLASLASFVAGQGALPLSKKHNPGRFSHSNGNGDGASRKRKTNGRKARATAKRRARRNKKI